MADYRDYDAEAAREYRRALQKREENERLLSDLISLPAFTQAVKLIIETGKINDVVESLTIRKPQPDEINEESVRTFDGVRYTVDEHFPVSQLTLGSLVVWGDSISRVIGLHWRKSGEIRVCVQDLLRTSGSSQGMSYDSASTITKATVR